MKKNELRKIAYQRYQLKWMIEHGKSLDLLKQELIANEEQLNDDEEKVNVLSVWDMFEEMGFHGEMYVCYDEFFENEFQNIDYMKAILSKTELEVWKGIRFASETDTFAEFTITGDYSVYTIYVPEDTNLDKADVSALIEYTLHSILDNDGTVRDVKNILGFSKVNPKIFASAVDNNEECTFTDLCFMANGYIERVWEEA